MFILFFACFTRFLSGNDEEAEVNSKLAASTLGELFVIFCTLLLIAVSHFLFDNYRQCEHRGAPPGQRREAHVH